MVGKSNMKERIGMMGLINKMDRREGNGLRENLTMIKVPEIIIEEMIEGMMEEIINGKIKITRRLPQSNGDPMIMSIDKRTMSGDKTNHQTNGEQIMNWTSNHHHHLIPKLIHWYSHGRYEYEII